jgi:cell division transport system permease protein
MKTISILRVIKFGLKNFGRNIWLSLATTFVMMLTLLTISSLLILNILGKTTLNSIKEKIDISVYLKPAVQEEDINEVKNGLMSLAEVKSIDFISKEDALESFKKKHGDNPLILSSIEEIKENPMQASLIVKARNPEDYAIISDLLARDQYKKIIDKVTFEDNKKIIEKITSTTNTIEKIGVAVSLAFIFITVILMFNTIRLTIYAQKDEIKVMRLVGATNQFIRLPYILESILYGLIASALCAALLYFSLKYFSPHITNFIEGEPIDIFAYLNTRIWYLLGLQIVLGIFLSMISSFIALRKYLRV